MFLSGLGSSTVDQVLKYTKYSKFIQSTSTGQVLIFFKKYLSTSSTFISSTSTHIKICSKVMMDIQSRVNFGWTKQKGFPQIMSLLNSQDGHILCRVNLEWTKYRGIISWSGYMIIWHQDIFSHHLKR